MLHQGQRVEQLCAPCEIGRTVWLHGAHAPLVPPPLTGPAGQPGIKGASIAHQPATTRTAGRCGSGSESKRSKPV